MATTKYRISEQVLRRLEGGFPDSADQFVIEEIILEIGQAANALIKASYATDTLGSGDTVPVASIIGTYSGIPVGQYKGVSKATLPVMPITLMRDQGVRQVGTDDDEYIQFIPMTQEAFILVKNERLISDLFGYIGFKREGFDLIFNRDLTTLPVPVNTIEAKLLVLDMDKLDIYDPLPLAADMEMQVIETVFTQIATRLMASSKSTDILDSSNNDK